MLQDHVFKRTKGIRQNFYPSRVRKASESLKCYKIMSSNVLRAFPYLSFPRCRYVSCIYCLHAALWMSVVVKCTDEITQLINHRKCWLWKWHKDMILSHVCMLASCKTLIMKYTLLTLSACEKPLHRETPWLRLHVCLEKQVAFATCGKEFLAVLLFNTFHYETARPARLLSSRMFSTKDIYA